MNREERDRRKAEKKAKRARAGAARREAALRASAGLGEQPYRGGTSRIANKHSPRGADRRPLPGHFEDTR